MRFMLLFYEPASAAPGDLTEFDAELTRRGVPFVAPALEAPENAASVRRNGAGMRRFQGPLVDAEQRLVGVRVIDCADQHAAVALAALAPSAKTGSVEVRAVHETEIIPDFDAPSR